MNSDRSTPQPSGPSLLKAVQLYFAEGRDMLRFVTRLARDYGDIMLIRNFGRHHYLVNHPDYIEKILMSGYKIRTSRPMALRHALGKGLVTSQGELHRIMRKTVQPSFHRPEIVGHAELMISEAEHTVSDWQHGQTLDIAEEMTHLTLGVIVNFLFGTGFRDEIKKLSEAAYLVHLHMSQDFKSTWEVLRERFPVTGKFTRLAKARQYLNEKIYSMMEKKRSEGNLEGQDFLSAMLRAQKTSPDAKDITDRQIRDEVITLFMAGHETVASALGWTWYLLSEHPEVERKMHEELKSVLGENGRRPTVEDVPKLVYTKMVLSESMRLYPPVWAAARRPDHEDLELEPYLIPRDSTIFYSQYVVHRDARFFPEPEHFIPERFTPEEEAKRPKFAYFPFAAGHRKCIGEGFAWQEALLAIAVIAPHWRLRMVKNHPIVLEPLTALKSKYGLRMTLEKRIASEKSELIKKHQHAQSDKKTSATVA